RSIRSLSISRKARTLTQSELGVYHLDELPELPIQHTDVLVVGGGAGGFSAATTAAYHGLDVILAEQSGACGGATSRSGGWAWTPGTSLAKAEGVDEDVEEFRALLQRLAAVRGRLSLCADQAAAAKWWLSMPMASVSAEGPMPKALSTRRTSPLMPGCRHQGRACPLRRARMTSNPLIVA